MVLFLFFIFFVVLESLFLPALIGPKAFLVIPLFALATIIYSRRITLRLVQVVTFLFFTEIFSGARVGSFMIPFIITAVFYVWINKFLDVTTNLNETNTLSSILVGILALNLLVYLYSFFFILNQLSYSVVSVWAGFKILIQTSFFETLGWSVVLVMLFKYVIKTK